MPETVIDAKDGILTLLDTQAAQPGSALQGVQRAWAHPAKNMERESIFFLTVDLDEQAAAISGRTPKPREEQYDLTLVVTVEGAGNDAEKVDRRLWALVREVSAALRSDHTFNGAVREGAIARFEGRQYPGAQKRISEGTFTIRCKARI